MTKILSVTLSFTLLFVSLYDEMGCFATRNGEICRQFATVTKTAMWGRENWVTDLDFLWWKFIIQSLDCISFSFFFFF